MSKILVKSLFKMESKVMPLGFLQTSLSPFSFSEGQDDASGPVAGEL